MAINDLISDMIAKISTYQAIGRNIQFGAPSVVSVLYSKACYGFLKTLAEEGYVGRVEIVQPLLDKPHKFIDVELLYRRGLPVISSLKRVSTPGRRVYVAANKIGKAMNNFGVKILSTNKGIMTDRNAKKMKVGGEIMGVVF